ncbi:MAG: hypothetical protein E7324_09150 [Clostridiales bacterium]|nr:hypothetical protein [Clostridiales bacterium]
MIQLTLHPHQQFQIIKGFGASGCWWGQNWRTHGWPRAWAEEIMALLYDPEKGMGLNTWRHNIGSGSKGGNIPPIRETPAVEAAPGVFDLSRDEEHLMLLDMALSYPQVNILTLFINSPPGRMTITGQPNGNPGWATNLKTECTGAFIDYAVQAAKAYRAAGYPVTYLSPINEPQWDWHAGLQEGCHYSVDQVMEISRGVAEKLENECPGVALSMPESARWDHPYMDEILQRLKADPALLSRIDHLCAHSYEATAAGRQRLMDLLKELDLPLAFHQTEWCEEKLPIQTEMDGALTLSRVLHEDLTCLQVPLWEFWKAIETNPDYWQRGLITVPLHGEDGAPQMTKRGWALAHYARFIVGSRRIGLTLSGEPEGVYGSAYEKDGRFILLLTNETTAPQMLSLAAAGGSGRLYCTDAQRNLSELGAFSTGDPLYLPPRSVLTLLMDG